MVEPLVQAGVLIAANATLSGQSTPVKRQPALAASYKQRTAHCAHAPEPYAAMASPGDWSTELWDVCAQPGGPNMCCLSLWCPCIQYGLLLEQLPPGSVTCAGSVAGSCALFCVLWLLGDVLGAALVRIMPVPCTALVHAQTRGYIRRKYGIQSHPIHDFFITWCCAPCALCQEAREAVIRQAAEREESSRFVSSSRGSSSHGPSNSHRPMTPKAAASGGPFAGGELLAASSGPPFEGGVAAPALVKATGASGNATPSSSPAPMAGVAAAVGSPARARGVQVIATVSHNGSPASGVALVAGAAGFVSQSSASAKPNKPD